MELEWDEEKRRAVLDARGVDLADTESALMDERAITIEQRRRDETRHVTVGMGPAGRLLTVVWTIRGKRLRIITAWKSNTRERKQYEGEP